MNDFMTMIVELDILVGDAQSAIRHDEEEVEPEAKAESNGEREAETETDTGTETETRDEPPRESP
jgi:Sec-independent protein translocase protein TatA